MISDALDYDANPTEALFVPGRDDGLFLLSDQQPHWRPVQGGRHDFFTVSEHPQINRRWRRYRRKFRATERFSTPVEYNAQPVVVENLTALNGNLAIGNKWFLNGHAGGRLLDSFLHRWKRSDDPQRYHAQFSEHFQIAQAPDGAVPVWDKGTGDLDFVVEARHLGNYYHFTTEVLSAIAAATEIPGFRGNILIVANRLDAGAFAMAFVQSLFPDIADRVRFLPSPHHFDRVLTLWHGHWAQLQQEIGIAEDLLPETHPIATGNVPPDIWKTLQANGYSKTLKTLGRHGRALAAGRETRRFPEKVWIARRAAQGNDRPLANEDRIIAELARRGFGVLYFEDLDPLDQIAAMAGASKMVSCHGAGFANLIYASDSASIVEIGTIQSSILRWKDFAGLAHASGAQHTLAIADHADESGRIMPRFRGGTLYPVRLTDDAIDEIVARATGAVT